MAPRRPRNAKGDDGLTGKQAYKRFEIRRLIEEGGPGGKAADKAAEKTWKNKNDDEKDEAVLHARAALAEREAADALAAGGGQGGGEGGDNNPKPAPEAWITWELSKRKLKGDEKPPLDEASIRQQLTDGWKMLSRDSQTELEAAYELYSTTRKPHLDLFKKVQDLKVFDQLFDKFSQDTSEFMKNDWEEWPTVKQYTDGLEQMLTAQEDRMHHIKELQDALDQCRNEAPSLPDTALKSLHKELKTLETNLVNNRKVLTTWTKRSTTWMGKFNAARMNRMRAEFSSNGAGWVGGWLFASGGGFGTPELWVKQSSRGVIVDRVVTKDSQFNDFTWNNELNFWSTNTHDGSRMPCEILALYNLRGRVGSENVMRIRNHRILGDLTRRTRTYAEFCPHGDLGQWTKWFGKERAAKPRSMWAELHADKDTKERSWLPEAFLWHVLKSLATAGLLMEKGELDDNPISSWDLILHLDLKPANVFLGLPLTGKHGYPTPKIGDFGLCTLVGPNDTRAPNEYLYTGTPLFRPPEQQLIHYYPGENTTRFMDSKTNVWGIGNVVWCLIEMEDGDHRLNHEQGFDLMDKERNQEPAFRAPARKHYSKELLGLIKSCTRYEQKDRPSFSQILNRIRRHAKPSPAGATGGALRFKKDKWTLGSPLVGLPPFGLSKMPDPPTEDDSDSEGERIGRPIAARGPPKPSGHGNKVAGKATAGGSGNVRKSRGSQARAGADELRGGRKRGAADGDAGGTVTKKARKGGGSRADDPVLVE